VDGGRWTVDGGRWTVDGGRWTVDGGRWTVDGGEFWKCKVEKIVRSVSRIPLLKRGGDRLKKSLRDFFQTGVVMGAGNLRSER
jgi:hypothetical protein